MTLIVEKSNQADNRMIEYNQEVVRLGLEKANLANDCEAIRKEMTKLGEERDKLIKEINIEKRDKLAKMEKEVQEYKYMIVLLPTLMKEVNEWKKQKEKLDEDIKNRVYATNGLIDQVIKLESDIKIKQEELQKIIAVKKLVLKDKQNTINTLGNEILYKKAELKVLIENKDKEQSEINIKNSQLTEREMFINRKAGDLEIYKKRVERKFKELFPDQEMIFM